MGLADHKHFLPVTRELVRGPQEPAPYLFSRLGIPKAMGYKVLRFYTFHGAVHTTRTGMQVDPREVVRLAGALRMDRAVPDRTLTRAADPVRLGEALDEQGIPYALGFQAAANRIGYFEPGPALDLYVPRDRQDMVHDLIVSHRTAGETRLHYESLDRLDIVEDADGVRITSPIQTLLDLATGSHGSAHLAFLMDVARIGGTAGG